MDFSPPWKTTNKRKPSFNALYKKSMTQHIDRKVKKVVRDPTPEQEEKKISHFWPQHRSVSNFGPLLHGIAVRFQKRRFAHAKFPLERFRPLARKRAVGKNKLFYPANQPRTEFCKIHEIWFWRKKGPVTETAQLL